MIKINLIPPVYIENEKKKRMFHVTMLGGGGIFLILAALGLVLLLKSRSLAKEVRNLETEIAKYSDVTSQMQALESEKSQIQAKINLVGKLLAGRYYYPKILESIATNLPSQIWFSSLSAQSADNAIQTQIQASAANLKNVIDWIAGLESNKQITNVSLGTITNALEAGESVASFQITYLYTP